MADYQGRIRLSVQGLPDVSKLDAALGSVATNADRLEATKIQLRVTGSEALGKLASQMSAVEARATRLASAVSRIGGDTATIRFNAEVDRQSISRQLDLVSRQFQRRNWRLNVNDTSVKTARVQVERLGSELRELVGKRYVINVDYRYSNPPGQGRAGGRPPAPSGPSPGSGGASPEEIARRAGEAMAGGLTGKLYNDAVAGARASAARQGLIERFQQRVQRPQSPGGINQSLAQRYIKALGGETMPRGTSPQGMVTEVERLLRTVDESVIKNITDRIDELKLALQMPRNMRLPARGIPNFDELLDRMAGQTSRPAEASRMLRMLPSRAITTNLAGLASSQAYRYMGPEMIPPGKDELFNEIKRLFGNYFKSLNPTNVWTGPERKPYALQEIMTWQPWMAEPRERRDRKALPAAGETARTVPVTDFSTLQTSYDEEIAKRNISNFAREVFGAQRRLALPAAEGVRAIAPASLYNQVIPVNVKDISQPAVKGIFNVGARGFAGGGAGTYQMSQQFAGRSPATYGAGSRPYQEPNWNELMDRMAAVARNPSAASRTLRAIPRQMVTTDLAGLATDQAAGLFGRSDPLGERIRALGREAGLAVSPLDRISDALRDAASSAFNFFSRVRQALGGGGSSGGGGGGGGGGFTPFGLLPPGSRPFARTMRRPDSAPLDFSQILSSNYYQQLAGTSADERRRNQYSQVAPTGQAQAIGPTMDAYVRSLIDAEQAQRSLNADVAAAREAVQRARAAYVQAGATQMLTTDQVRGTRSVVTRNRRANFVLEQRRIADQIENLESQRAPVDIFRNYGQLQGLYGQLPITQRRGAMRNLRSARSDAMRNVSSEVLIGGAFPLLFGQGAATAAGGAIGGAASLFGPGAGFAGGLVGSAVGMQIDMLTTNLSNLAGSLKSPNDAIAALEASGFRVGDSLKFQVEQLQSVGRAYDAQTLVLREVQKRLGPDGVRNLLVLETEQKRLQEQWSSIAGTLQSELLPALIGFTQVVNGVLGVVRGAAQDPLLSKLAGGAVAVAGALVPGGGAAITALRAAGARGRETIASAGSFTPPALRAQEAFAAETTRIQESRRIADQIQSAYREAFQLQRQAYDLQREGADINREIADYSYRKQREIFDLRQQVAEKEIENNRAAAQNRIERGDLGARQAFAAATGFEQQLLSNVREVMRARKEGEADIEQSRRRLELTMAKLNRDVEDYKRTTSREIEDIERRKLAYVRSVEDYRMRVADYVLQRSREAADLMRQAMAQGEAGGSGGAAMGGKSGYFARLAELESSGGKNWTNPTSNARGFFQLIPKTENWLKSIGKNDLATRMLSRDFATASQAAKEFAILMRPAAKGLMEAGDVSGLDRLLNRIWTSLPGGAEAATGQRLARANALLTPQAMGGVVGLTGATGIGTGAHLDVRWADGRPITSADADRFIRVAGQLPSSFGVTSGYGPRRAPVPGASTFHKGIDFGTPAGKPITLTGGARLTGSMTEAQSGGGGIVGIIDTPMGQMKLLHLEKVLGGNMHGSAATTISNTPRPQFNPTAVGPTPAAAPVSAAREALGRAIGATEQEADRILENQIKLRQEGIELGQIEEILQANQLPQLEQQTDELQRQIDARSQDLELSDQAASIADVRAQGEARITKLLEERRKALEQVQKQYPGNIEAIKTVNKQSAAAIAIAKGEEDQRLKNVDLSNRLQDSDRARTEILRLQEALAVQKAQAAALERGELEASTVELLKASTLYEQSSDAQRARLEGLTVETEELRKQNEFRQRIAELDRDTSLIGAGLRSGRVGAEARAFEQGLRDLDGDTGRANQLADRTKKQEEQRLVWENLEKNIIDVSDAISGSLTNGLLDIISGARKIEDVGREVLDSMARTFADSAQQQLSALLQRQLGGMLGGEKGVLARLFGAGVDTAGPQAVAATGAQALGTASFTAAGQVTAFGVALQTVMGQMALSGAMSGSGSLLSSAAGSVASSLFSPGAGGFFSPDLINFGGFLAQGGTTGPNEGYIVGEKEPEFFFPGKVGRVVPRSDMEKAKELRQGGSKPEPIDVRYTVTEQQGQRFVTEEQYRKGNAALLQRAQAVTLGSMRNSKDTRDYVGI